MSICQASEKDIPAIARIHVEGWKASYGGIVDQNYLDNLNTAEFEQKWQEWMKSGQTTTFLAMRDDKPAGFITYGKVKTLPPGQSNIRPQYTAEIYALYVLPDYWGQRLGKELMQEAAARLKDLKHGSLCLWVVKDNDRAIGFYEKLGGQRIGKHDIRIGPSKVREVCYGWRNTDVLLPSA